MSKKLASTERWGGGKKNIYIYILHILQMYIKSFPRIRIKLIIGNDYPVLMAILTLQNGSSSIIGERHSSSSVWLVQLKYSNPKVYKGNSTIITYWFPGNHRFFTILKSRWNSVLYCFMVFFGSIGHQPANLGWAIYSDPSNDGLHLSSEVQREAPQLWRIGWIWL